MAVLKCKMCGGDLVLNSDSTIAECEFCGTQQTVPTADNEKKITLFQRANRLRFACEFDKAAGIYESIVAEFPEEAEAYWGLILCKYGIEYVDDPATAKKIPTCHRSSFDSVLDDSNFELVMENADSTARGVYRNEAKQIEELRKSIIEVSSKEEPYDIFICYKETAPDGDRTIDSVIAQDVYDALTEKGYRVFFSRITLEDKLGQEYEPYIFAALNSAKIMLAFGTDYEYYNAVWVKNEWSRFLQLIAKGEKKTLIPCYKNIDAYDMPKEFAKLQAQDMGKVGAIQDLLRGIEKLLPKQTETVKETVKETVVVQQAGGNATVDSLLKRMFIFLEDKDFASANEYAEKVLDIDPENAQAYLGKVLVMLKISDISGIGNSDVDLSEDKNFERAIRYSTGEDKAKLEEVKEKNKINVEKQKSMALFLKLAEVENGILKKYIGENRDVCIPDGIESIGESAFEDCSFITSVTFPDSVTSIGDMAFVNCKSLASITIPESVTSIGSGAFSGCDSLIDIVIYGDNFRFTDNCLIDIKQKRLIVGFNNAKIPQDGSVTSIGDRAFWGCESLTSVTIPDSVTSIGSRAFLGCKSLTSVTIPDSVTSIGDIAFWGCESLTSVTIPDSVTSIGESTFVDCKSFVSITIPDSVTSIGDRAFWGCESLTSVTIPDSVTSIGESTFGDCKSLVSITIPDSVTSIGRCAFEDCRALTSVTIPDSVTSIGICAFEDCRALTSVTIPDSVTSIGSRAFLGCESLTSVTIPDSVTSIGDSAFNGCESLASVTIPESVTRISDSAFWGCKSLASVTIPDSVTSIGDSAFRGCESLASVTIPDSVTSIGICAFEDCRALTSVTIPDSVTNIGYSAFSKRITVIYANEDSYAIKWAKKEKYEHLSFAELAERSAKEEKRRLQNLMASRRELGVCQHCGGDFKGLFSKKCVSCGKPKDY